MKTVAIIGAGAAGCFCAAELRRMAPDVAVTVFEAGSKPLAKVAITGGGRCNLTNDFEGIRSLAEAYPRGERVMKRALKAFSNDDTIRWFTERGVPCVLQEDHCWFPRSQDAMDIVRCLQRGIDGVEVRLGTPVRRVEIAGQAGNDVGPRSIVTPDLIGGLLVNSEPFDYVVVTTGGMSRGASMFEGLGLEIIPPIPSLFTLNIPDKALTSLMGLVVDASVSLQGTAFRASGPLLITDWGVSGPATLKLSSYAARHLAENQYKANVSINWLDSPENTVRETLQKSALESPQKQVSNTPLLQQRLWNHIMEKAGLRKDIRWAELGSKGLNRLIATLTQDTYPVSGKGRFKEEFVTAGGIGLNNIDISTLESKSHKGLFFAGEVLDIDAITGGFNLQAAWSTAHVCACSIAKEK
ncbi:MAG: aminoacetone oxidase family FAD-binding enzyme [Bacteroidales bacterium]|nr:aminoacetone oxidase family FAD-binding enzyme [Bacteroidales bacterium]